MVLKRWKRIENVLVVFVREVGDRCPGTDKFSKYLFNHFSLSRSFSTTEVSPKEVPCRSFHVRCIVGKTLSAQGIPCKPQRGASSSTATSSVPFHTSPQALHLCPWQLPPSLTSATAPQAPLIGQSTEVPFPDWLECCRRVPSGTQPAATGCDRLKADHSCLPYSSQCL